MSAVAGAVDVVDTPKKRGRPRKVEVLEPLEEFRRKSVLAELKRRRQEEGIETYEPQDYQIPFHQCTAKRVLSHGGWRSGKTISGIVEVLWQLLGIHPYKKTPDPPTYWRVCGSGMQEQVAKVLVAYFRRLTPRRMLKDGEWNYSQQSHMLEFANGSSCEFMSFDQDPDKGQGRPLHGILLDDVGCSRYFMERCRSRLADYDGMMIRTICPEDGIGWEYDWYEKAAAGEKNYARFRMRPIDNKHLSKEGLQQLIDDIGDDENQRRIGIEGDFLEVGGLIYPTLKREFHVKHDSEVGFDIERGDWPTGVAIDPGVSKEHCVGWFAVGPGGKMHFYREHAVAGTIPELCAKIKAFSGLDRLQYFFLDGHWDWDNRTAHSAFGLEPLNIEKEFHKCGVPVTKAPLDIRNWQGIDQVRARLKPTYPNNVPLLTFSPECERTWYEMTHYSQIPPKRSDPTRHNPRIRKVDDDFPDVVRIAVTSNPEFSGVDARFQSQLQYMAQDNMQWIGGYE